MAYCVGAQHTMLFGENGSSAKESSEDYQRRGAELTICNSLDGSLQITRLVTLSVTRFIRNEITVDLFTSNGSLYLVAALLSVEENLKLGLSTGDSPAFEGQSGLNSSQWIRNSAQMVDL